MKRFIKKALALIISVAVLILSVAVYADAPIYDENSGNYKNITFGEKSYAVSSGFDYTIFNFEPTEAAEYTVSASGNLLGIVSYNGMWLTYEPSADTITETSIDWNCTGVGQSIWVAVKNPDTANVTVKIAKKEIQIQEIEWTMYQNVHTPVKFTFTDDIKNLKVVDTKDGVDDSPVLGQDGYYHLWNEYGPVLYADLDDAQMNLIDAQSYGQLRYTGYDGDTIVTKTDFYDAFEQYSAAADDNTKLYPLTEDLIQIYKLVGQSKGWYGEEGWLGGDEYDCWMFACYYVESPVLSIEANMVSPIYTNIGMDLYYTLYLTVNYKDGTVFKGNIADLESKTQQSVILDTTQCDENLWAQGIYSARIVFMNVSADFEIEIIENFYNEIEISGENELIITLKTDNGQSVSLKALGFEQCAGSENSVSGIVYTDKFTFNAEFSYDTDENFNPLYQQNLKITAGNLSSNSLNGNKWFEGIIYKDRVLYAVKTLHYYNEVFGGYDQVYLQENIDNIITLSADICELTWLSDNLIDEETGTYAVCSMAEIEDGIKKVFGNIDIDITNAIDYDSETNTVKVLRLDGDDAPYLKDFWYNNGKWYIEGYISDSETVSVTLNDDFTVSEIEICDKKPLNVRDLVRLKKYFAGVGKVLKISDDYSKDGQISTLDLTSLRKILINATY